MKRSILSLCLVCACTTQTPEQPKKQPAPEEKAVGQPNTAVSLTPPKTPLTALSGPPPVGKAAMLKTPTARKGFVAAFANSSCGDVSGNFDAATPLGQFDEVSSADPVQVRRHIARMRRAGDAQATAAQVLFAAAQTPLTGPILAREQVVDMVMRTGAPGALGVSMACGSTEDGAGPLGFVGEGVQLVDPARPDKTSHGPLGVLVQPIAFLLNAINPPF